MSFVRVMVTNPEIIGTSPQVYVITFTLQNITISTITRVITYNHNGRINTLLCFRLNHQHENNNKSETTFRLTYCINDMRLIWEVT